MTNERDDEPLLRDARERARTGGAGNPATTDPTPEGGAAGLGLGGDEPEFEAAEERADDGVPTGGTGESRSAIAPGSPEHHAEPHPAAGTGASGPGTSVVDPDDADFAPAGETESADVFDAPSDDDTVGGELGED